MGLAGTKSFLSQWAFPESSSLTRRVRRSRVRPDIGFDSLRDHVHNVHRNHRFPCTMPGCPKTFGMPRQQTKHIRSKHDGARYPCSYNGRKRRMRRRVLGPRKCKEARQERAQRRDTLALQSLCRYCKRFFTRRDPRTSHEAKHTHPYMSPLFLSSTMEFMTANEPGSFGAYSEF